ncbi:hypothetical protein [Dyella sp. EPa41]|uniref:hypothetical protein n=1 Tax=Dyella sp. EPa41 TaxID=1561194 RepID=UPI0019151B02|nr:hypothetical protein [Dyella sp. EPa41]
MSVTETGKTPCVLIVDDTPDNRLRMSELPSPLYRVLAAAADLILPDVMTPGMYGFGAPRQLKSKPRTRSPPIFAPRRGRKSHRA